MFSVQRAGELLTLAWGTAPERTDRDDHKCRKRSREEDASFYFAFMRNDYELGSAVLDYVSG